MGQAVPDTEMVKYKSSYVSLEGLTYETEKGVLAVNFPQSTAALIDKLKYLAKDDKRISQNPIIRGYLFEDSILETKSFVLMASVKRKNEDLKHVFQVPPSTGQLNGALTSIFSSTLYHLRVQHPAIDAVGLFKNDLDDDMYLVLLQVSLSTYANHEAKSVDIYKSVSSFESHFSPNSCTIAAYYKNLARVDEQHVVYIYLSPKEYYSSGDILAALNVSTVETRNSERENYWFGLVQENTNTSLFVDQISSQL